MEFIKNYIGELKKTIDTLDPVRIKEIAEILLKANADDKVVFFCGNGGSAASASHMANDLSKLTISPNAKRFKVVALTDNVPLLTAWANDTSYEQCFVEPLKNLYREGDILIGISGSGNSKNVLNAVNFVNQNKGITIGFTGFSGGTLLNLAQKTILVKSNNMQRIEDVHVVLGHLVCSYIADIFRGACGKCG